MNVLERLAFCIVLLFLGGCVVSHQTPAASKCLKLCEETFLNCSNKCANSCSRCNLSLHNTSKINYNKYLNERKVEGAINARNLQSYRDPLQCRKVTCNCDIDLTTCTQNCTGVVKKSLQSVPICN